MKPIKILQIFTVLNKGGAETNLMNYYRNMDRSQFQIDFLVHRESGFFEDEILKAGSKIYRLPPILPWKLKEYKKAVKVFLMNIKIMTSSTDNVQSWAFLFTKKQNAEIFP
jgi:hypothetical protein